MKKLLFVSALALAAAAGGCTKADSAPADKADKADTGAKAKDDAPAMTADDVEKQLADKKLTAVDCNNDQTRKKEGTLPGAIAVASPKDFDASVLPADKAAKLVFYCADESCHACHVGAAHAKELGYTNVYVMPQGILGWVKAGKKTQSV